MKSLSSKINPEKTNASRCCVLSNSSENKVFQHHAIPGPSWIDPMTMIFYSPVEKSYISLLSKKNDETIPLSLKKKFMHQTIRLIQHAGQTSGVFFKVWHFDEKQGLDRTRHFEG